MSNIEKILKQAAATFSKPQLASKYHESLNALVQAAGKLTGDDVGVDSALVKQHNSRDEDAANPVGYISVYEDSSISVSVFVLKVNSVLPLHDHPVMHGIIKVLHGSVRIQSYSLMSDTIRPRNGDRLCSLNDYYHVPHVLYPDPIRARRNPSVVLSPNDGCGLLTPTENNIHEVSSVNGPSAFLDILAPPYDAKTALYGPRPCLYFDVEHHSDTVSTLTPAVYHSNNYWTVELPYRGPKMAI
ncbi:hypothetical protein V9T40_007210 [Parthenolecanium corni]|uniref:2-aminoethanethiol dioxygenase n=1 Tax=Parthenolecanium corni TaxID=536013 RepID=A0AAN9TX22_9HEMI